VIPLREKRHGFGRSFIRYDVSVKWSQDVKLSRLTHRVTAETRNIEGSLWIDAVMADYIPYTGDDQNQTIGARFQIVV
jgi:hypothetical protein